MKIKTDDLAYWFFRLNGFLTTVNFVVHRERRGETGTDVDILGVRFPYRAELFERPMEDYKKFTKIKDRPYVIIAEVKKGLCEINGPWKDREKQNVDRILRAIGIIPLETIESVADSLYINGTFTNSDQFISIVCVGEIESKEIDDRYPLVPQITWSEIISFIFNRFNKYKNQKNWHQHWDDNGKKLWDYFCHCNNLREFSKGIEII